MKYLILIFTFISFSLLAKANDNNFFKEAKDLFDNEKGVLIMSEDLKIRNNRLNLLSLIRNYSLKIADLTLLNS